MENYDLSGVSEEVSYPVEAVKQMAEAKFVVTSDLKRAVDSALFLDSKVDAGANPIFRETEVPVLPGFLKTMRMKPGTLGVLLRLIWLGGYSNGCESIFEAKARAEVAAEQLVEHSKIHGSVVLVGHGFFNLLLAKQLQKKAGEGKRIQV